ncbi:MAG UNVERIFIED_CONTAM: hypothetical protein LVR29_14470 [Microcystis novacekii LVE1205-3]
MISPLATAVSSDRNRQACNMVSYQLSVISYQLSVIQLSVISDSVISYQI